MAFDGSTMLAIMNELKSTLIGLRIEKIYQTNETDIIIQTRKLGEKIRLFISANPSFPRINLTSIDYENPNMPPNFCMLLRKHIQGGIIKDISQYKMDRILFIDIESKTELLDTVTKRLAIEIMGKHSNIILTEKDKIIDSIKRVNPNISRVRSVLPGLLYTLHDISEKKDPLILNKEDLLNDIINANQNKSLKNTFIGLYTGISPSTGREIASRVNLDEDTPISYFDKSDENLEKILDFFEEIKESKNGFLVYDENKKLIDFLSFRPSSYQKSNLREVLSISKACDIYYEEKSINSNLKNIGSDVLKLVENKISKSIKKLEKLNSEIDESKNREIYKIYGDLLSSNLYRIERGLSNITLENYFDEMNPIEIPLDKKISAQENARKYYKKYQKMKTRENVLAPEIETTKSEILYLQSVKTHLLNSTTKEDIEEIKDELSSLKYIKKKSKEKIKPQKPLSFETEDGFKIYVGKNNRQNDKLTFKDANREDLWFHVKDAPGSHVLIKFDGREFSENAILTAAKLAAKYSSLKDSNNVSIDYTKKKFVKRHPLKVLGLAIYTDYKTINI